MTALAEAQSGGPAPSVGPKTAPGRTGGRSGRSGRSDSLARWWSAAWPPLLLAALAVVLWQLAIDWFGISSYVIAKPTDIVVEMVTGWQVLLTATWVTTQEVVIGFLISIVVGVVIALA